MVDGMIAESSIELSANVPDISIEKFKEEVDVWNYHLSIVHNYVSDGFLSHNIALIKDAVFTSGHQYVKQNNVSIDVGDLVKLDSNNQIRY